MRATSARGRRRFWSPRAQRGERNWMRSSSNPWGEARRRKRWRRLSYSHFSSSSRASARARDVLFGVFSDRNRARLLRNMRRDRVVDVARAHNVIDNSDARPMVELGTSCVFDFAFVIEGASRRPCVNTLICDCPILIDGEKDDRGSIFGNVISC